MNYRARLSSLQKRILMLEKEKEKLLKEILELEEQNKKQINTNDLKRKYGSGWKEVSETLKKGKN